MEEVKSIQDPESMFNHCARYTDKKQTCSEGNRNNYIHLLAHNCNRRGLSQEQTLYYCVNKFDLPTQEIEETIKSAYTNSTEHATEDEREKKFILPNVDRIENFLSERYEFRYNIVLNKLEFRVIEENIFVPFTDYKENSILRELHKARIKCSIGNLRIILGSDFCEKYNPFISYFNSLPEWDKTTDHIKQLANTVECTNQELWQYCFPKWLVEMVGCAIDDEVCNHCVVIFSGKQGIGKTKWVRNLLPAALKGYLFSGTIDPNNKDTLIHLSECLLINLDELENLNRTEIGSLKEIITKENIRLRVAYGHHSENKIRRASFAGSVNSLQFLSDTTGSRRFLCFEATSIEYKHKVDMDNVFAQAFHLFKNDFKFWFDKEEIKTINNNNEQYQLKTAEEELLLTWFEKPKDSDIITYLSTSEIATKLCNMAKLNYNNSSIQKLGKALTKHSFTRTKRGGGGRYVYEVVEKTYQDVERESKETEQKETLPQPDKEIELPF